MTHLENILDAMKPLPNELQREFSLILELDKRVEENKRELEKEQNALLESLKDEDDAPSVEWLSRIREYEREAYSMSNEKIALAKQARDIISTYITRCDEEAALCRMDIPPDVMITDSYEDPSRRRRDTMSNPALYGLVDGNASAAVRKGKAMKAPRAEDPSSSHNPSNPNISIPPPPLNSRSTSITIPSMNMPNTPVLSYHASRSTSSMSMPPPTPPPPPPPPTRDRPRAAAVAARELLQMEEDTEGGESDAESEGEAEGGGGGEGDGEENAGNEEVYCTCRQPSYGEMVGCDGQNCRYEWFHFGCVGLKKQPKGSWMCEECTQQARLAQPAGM